MLRKLLILAGATVVGIVLAQTLPSLVQIRPSSGPSTAIVVTVGTKAMWADLGPGLAVDVMPTGRAMIRAVPQGTHSHVMGQAANLTWEDPRTCFTTPPTVHALAVRLNGIDMTLNEDYAPVSASKFCFIPHYANLLVNTDGANRVSLDYITIP